jgi:hypothetical protein
MDAAPRKCIQLINEIDTELMKLCGQCSKPCNPLVLTHEGKECLQDPVFVQKNFQLVEAMKDAFIEPVTKALKTSALLLFCHKNGLELIKQSCQPHVKASFTVRTDAFDLSVES